MHAIAATTCAPNHIDIFYLEPGFGMAHKSWDGTQWHVGWDELGGTFTSVPAAVASRAPHHAAKAKPNGATSEIIVLQCRVDVFGLGPDYVMYHQTLWNGTPAQNPQWTSLGGVFTSAPAAVAWQGQRIEVFGLGLDRAMYRKFWNGTTWSSQWERLGGTFSSAASVVSWGPNRIDVFVRGSDYTLRHRAFNNLGPLTDWQNLGGSLASPPAAITWGQDRLDVFAVGHDGALWHRWWDGNIWNDWESLGGSFTSAPSAVTWAPNRMDVFVTGTDPITGNGGAVSHFWWSDETWYGPESFQGDMTSAPTAISIAPNRLNVLAPGKDQNIYHRAFDGAAWTPGLWEQLGGHIALPTRYRLSVDFVTCDTPRAFISDTDTAQATIAPGNWPTQSLPQVIGDIGGTHPSQAQTNLLNFEPVTIELCEDVRFNYIVINNGHADQVSLDAAITSAGSALASAAVTAVAGSSILGTVAGWLLGKLGGFLFQDCDGIVAVEQIQFTGRDLHLKTGIGELDSVITLHPGTDSPTGCGGNSQYEVTWSIKRA
jgi:hypothetical protein